LPEDDLGLLCDAARAAGETALGYYGRNPRVWNKPGEAGPVTEADLAVDALLKTRLCDARPGYGWLSEETPDDGARLGHEHVFIVDPIDGTRAFIRGDPGWCVALAVARAGEVVAAAAWFPALGALYAAAKGRGATRDGRPIPPVGPRALEGAHVLAGAAQLDAGHWPGGAPSVRRTTEPSLIHRICLVADGAADATLTFRDAWEWDIAAGALIALEANCAVTDGNGAIHRYNAPSARSKGLLVAPAGLHAALLARRLGH